MKPITEIHGSPKGLNAAVLALFKEFPGVFLTGSRAFGWSTPESDFDVCIFAHDKPKAFAMIEAMSAEYKDSEYYDGAKGSGIVVDCREYQFVVSINPIPLHPLDMLCWWLASREIMHIGHIDSSRLGSRETKHGAFEILRGFYKSVLPYQGEKVVMEQLRKEQDLAGGRTHCPLLCNDPGNDWGH